MRSIDRRTLLGTAIGAATAAPWAALIARAAHAAPAAASTYDGFPSVERSRVLETVRYAHVDLDRVERLVRASPSLANAAVDWGFGDWESAVGAAAHMGRSDIAQLLLAHGARPDLFTHAMLGDLSVVRSTIEARPGIQRETGPHGFTLLHHARAGGDAAQEVVAYLEELGDADPQPNLEDLPRDATEYIGTYTWSESPTDRLEITATDGRLALSYGEAFPRALFHLGDDTFYPTGAAAVRIRFNLAAAAATVTILDPTEILKATRRSAPESSR